MLLVPYNFVNHNQDEITSPRDNVARDLQSHSLSDFNFCNRGEGKSSYCSKIALDRSPLNWLISNDLTHNQKRDRKRNGGRGEG